MKRIILSLVILFLPGIVRADYNAVIKQAKEENKQVFLLFTADWCENCTAFKDSVLSEQVVSAYINKHYIYYECNVDKERAVAKIYQKAKFLNGIPSVILVDGDSKVQAQHEGNMSVDEFKAWLKDNYAPRKDTGREDFKKVVDAYVGMTSKLVTEGTRNSLVYRNDNKVMLFYIDISKDDKTGEWSMSYRSKALPAMDDKK